MRKPEKRGPDSSLSPYFSLWISLQNFKSHLSPSNQFTRVGVPSQPSRGEAAAPAFSTPPGIHPLAAAQKEPEEPGLCPSTHVGTIEPSPGAPQRFLHRPCAIWRGSHCVAPLLPVGLLPQSCTTGVQWVQAGSPRTQLQSFLGTHWLLAAALQPLAAHAAARPGFCSLCPSLSIPQYLLLNIYNTPKLLSSTLIPTRESLPARVRHALGQCGQSWGWEKMAFAWMALLCHTPASFLRCSCSQWVCGHPSSITRLEDSAASLSSLEHRWLNIYVRWCFWSGLLSEHHSIYCPS